MNNLSVVDFNTKYSSQCIDYWYNIKERRLGQTKRKKYAPRNSTKRKHSTFNVKDLMSKSDSLDTSDEDQFYIQKKEKISVSFIILCAKFFKILKTFLFINLHV